MLQGCSQVSCAKSTARAILSGGEEMMTLQVIRELAVCDTFDDFGDDGERGNRAVIL